MLHFFEARMLFFYYFSFCEQSLYLEFKIRTFSAGALLSIILWIRPQIWMLIDFPVNEDLGENEK